MSNRETLDDSLLDGDVNFTRPTESVDCRDYSFVTTPVRRIHYFQVFFIMFMTFGSYWIFDTPSAIQTQLRQYLDPNSTVANSWYDNSHNLTLMSVYSYPNVILALFGGYIIDSVTGLRLGALLFAALVLAGQFLFSGGIMVGGKVGYTIMVIARFIFGLGGENLTVAQSNYTVKYFERSGHLAFAMGIVVSFQRIGSSINFVVTPALAGESVPLAIWFGTAMCGLSFIASLCAFFVDIKYDKQQFRKSQQAQLASDYGDGDASMSVVPDEIRLSDIKKFPLPVWLLYFITLCFYVAILTFFTVASDCMQNVPNIRDALSGTTVEEKARSASFYLFIPNCVAIIVSPLTGKIVDKKGRALNVIAFASLMFIVGHLYFLALANSWIEVHDPDYLWLYIGSVMVWLGAAYSLGAACLWPILSLIVPARMVATGYGAMTAIQNLGLAVFPQMIGLLQDTKGISDTPLQYTIPIIIFIGVSALSFFLTLWLITVDRMTLKGKLNMSAMERDMLRQTKEDLYVSSGVPRLSECEDVATPKVLSKVADY